MKTLFDPERRTELIRRIGRLDPDSKALWGKMNVYQMAKHCVIWNEWVLGKSDLVTGQEFLGKLFGKMALRSNTRDDKPLSRHMPAGKNFTVKEAEENLDAWKVRWISLTEDYAEFANDGFIHDFFGPMSREQIGIFAYKHIDHHLRQFGV